MAPGRGRCCAQAGCFPRCLVFVVLPWLADLASIPRFKWAQTIDNIFVVVTVKELETESVVVNLRGVDHLSVSASGIDGEFELELPLREDVKEQAKVPWEISARANRFGNELVITLVKQNLHRWDRLVTDSRPFKNLMEKDWSRDNSTLEAVEEFPYQEAYPKWLTDVNEENFNETIARSRPLFLNVKYPWCHRCRTKTDTAFLGVAKDFGDKGKKDPAYKAVTFGVLDARENRVLARRFGGGLAPMCGVCEVKVFTEVDEEPEYIKDIQIMDDFAEKTHLYMVPALDMLTSLQDPALESLKANDVTCVGSFVSKASPSYAIFKNVSRIMRGQLKFAAAFGKENVVEMWHPKENTPYVYEGNWTGKDLLHWVRSRSLPLLQEYSWRLRERYDSLQLPIAKLWTNVHDGKQALDDQARSIARRLALENIGSIAFVETPAQAFHHELHDFMLDQPEVYPAFGVQSNNSGQAHRYGFEIPAEVALDVEDFWKNEEGALPALREFLKDALDDKLPGAHESGTPQTDWVKGNTRNFCWREYSQLQNPTEPLLLELWNRFRVDRDEKEASHQHLSEVLLPYADSFTVARYDTGVNYFLKQDFNKRTKKQTESEWYWIAKGANGTAVFKKLRNPSIDASARDAIAFAKKNSGLEMDVSDLSRQHERKMKVWKKFKSFSKLNELGPDETFKFPKGFNVLVQVAEVGEIEKEADGTEFRSAVVGDKTGIMKMRFQGANELEFAEVGKAIEARNAKIVLVKGNMVISVGKWGLITAHDGEAEVKVNPEGDFTAHVFRDKNGKARDEL